ncbi:hypothetical protein chiPu_0026723 [Chiloscyllium punctatum]|uniref:Uncharacterized protein n=1 Tax=Chiloscyllium punctatum TaxID=137246 RepID=A0A401TJJ2_CHIPU|nr:hypothetical protein [Chiloscyllium punctatum]
MVCPSGWTALLMKTVSGIVFVGGVGGFPVTGALLPGGRGQTQPEEWRCHSPNKRVPSAGCLWGSEQQDPTAHCVGEADAAGGQRTRRSNVAVHPKGKPSVSRAWDKLGAPVPGKSRANLCGLRQGFGAEYLQSILCPDWTAQRPADRGREGERERQRERVRE